MNERPTGTLVLLHAFPLDRTIFDDVVGPVVDAGWDVVAPDLRGFGESAYGPDGPDDEPSLAAVARDVLAGLDRLGVAAAVVGGVSLGGYVAMELLRTAPERVAGLVLIDTKAGADTPEARENRLRIAAEMESTGDVHALAESMLPGLLGPTSLGEQPQVVARVRRLVEAADPRAVAWMQRAMAARPDSIPDLDAYPGPVRMIWGEQDALASRADQDAMVATGADLVVIPDAGHLAVLERPAAVAAALVEYLVRGTTAR